MKWTENPAEEDATKSISWLYAPYLSLSKFLSKSM